MGDVIGKIKNLIFARRAEAKNKWWHRLALVLIYGSTVFVTVFLAALLISDEGGNWVSSSYTAYSFEQGYEEAEGKEIDCRFSVTGLGDLPRVSFFRCGDLSSGSEFLGKYAHASGSYENLEQMREQRIQNTPARGGGLYQRVAKNVVDGEIMVQLIQEGKLDNIKVKRTFSIDYASFFGNWGIFILFVLGWLIFWESIIYRTILYIIYGRAGKTY